MILLFKDNSVNYWVKNTVVDCGKADISHQVDFITEQPNDILLEELEHIIHEENKKMNNNLKQHKKLNNNFKQHKLYNNNVTDYERVYVGRNSKITDYNSGGKDTRYTNRGYMCGYKDSNIRINNLQETSKYQCLHKNIITNYDKRKMLQMSPSSNVYCNKSRKK